MKKVRKRISIGKFMKLWNLARNGSALQIAPNTSKIIQDEWKLQVQTAFNLPKTKGSYGPISNDNIKDHIQHETKPTPNVGYANKWYVKVNPETYQKTGELYRAMSKDTPYKNAATGRKLGLKVTIPLKRLNVPDDPKGPYTYRYLEKKRSFVKAAFLNAWPEILEQLMNEIADR